MTKASSTDIAKQWFSEQDWQAREFQVAAWQAFDRGESGLINVPTGAGKTYAAAFGPLAQIATSEDHTANPKLLYITPLRALTRDIQQALQRPLADLAPHTEVAMRTGDSTSSERARLRRKMPAVLITTPESLALMLSHAEQRQQLANLKAVVVDEWHELMSTKRGSLLELNMAQLRHLAPDLRTWGLSATLGEPQLAAERLVGSNSKPTLINPGVDRPINIRVLWPSDFSALPWVGHLGLRLLTVLAADLDWTCSSLVFTNTRSQAEIWHSALKRAFPDRAHEIGLHHGSLDRKLREQTEAGIKAGDIKVTVCTSSLDLGVDYGPVEKIYQIGSPKAVARIIQRAGRSAHRPGATCEIAFLPTHALEVLEVHALRSAIKDLDFESVKPPEAPIDVLVQHLANRAAASPFHPDDVFAEVRQAQSFATLDRSDFDWALDFLSTGGQSLSAYPNYHRLKQDSDGKFHFADQKLTQVHRLNIGTITSDAAIPVRYHGGATLGHVEERFIAGREIGDVFIFAGRMLELKKLKDDAAIVVDAKKVKRVTPRWGGGQLALTDTMSHRFRNTISSLSQSKRMPTGFGQARPLVAAQQKESCLPLANQLLLETMRSDDGYHLFFYPFEGQHINRALGVLLALRLGANSRTTFGVGETEYGVELISPHPIEWEQLVHPHLFGAVNLAEDMIKAVNLSELAKRHFREIARISGLINENFPGKGKTMRQLRSSSGLLYDVLQRFEPGHRLLHQAEAEVMSGQFDLKRLRRVMDRLQTAEWIWKKLTIPGPLAMPLVFERLSATLSHQTMAERAEELQQQWLKSTKRQ